MHKIKDNNNFWFVYSFVTQLFLFSYIQIILVSKKSLKIPKGQSEHRQYKANSKKKKGQSEHRQYKANRKKTKGQ